MLATLIPPAYAQDVGSLMTGAMQFAPLVLIFAVFYFILIRPQQQKQKEVKRSLAALRRGDRVVTGGGILATVQRVREGSNEVEIEIAPNVRVAVLRDTITSVLRPAAAANDAKPPAKVTGT